MAGKNVEKANQTLCCSFCGKSQKEVKKLIAGPTVYICDECIGLCNDIIAEADALVADEGGTPSPSRGLPLSYETSLLVARLSGITLMIREIAESFRMRSTAGPEAESMANLDRRIQSFEEALRAACLVEAAPSPR